MTTTTPWSDTPPSEPGKWWAIDREKGYETICLVLSDGAVQRAYLEDPEPMDGMAKDYQFGPAVLSAEETVALTAEVERLRADCTALRETINELEWELSGKKVEEILPAIELSDLRYKASETERYKAGFERLERENAELRATLVSVAAVDELPEYRSVPFRDAGKIMVRVSGATPLEPMPYPIGDGLDMDGNPID